MPAERSILTIGHSYAVAANRRLAHEMALQGHGRWTVTAIAPIRFPGDLGEVVAQPFAGESSALRTAPVRFARSPHFMRYGALQEAMRGSWDVVHAWEEPYVAAGAQIAASAPASSTFVVSTFQNIRKAYPWPLSQFERTTMARAAGWIPFGNLVHAALGQKPPYADKPSRIIPPGVDLDAFAPDPRGGAAVRREMGWPETAPVIGYLGRFEPHKGLDTLSAAFEELSGPWNALFVGGGTLERKLRDLEKRHGTRVRVITGVAHAQVPRWLNAMTLLCAPSVTTARWREQFGRMLIEAMACGVPVIGSDSGEIPFVIADAGLIAPESNAPAWRAAIESLLGDPLRRRQLSALGLDRARTHFAWPAVARAHLSWFEELAA